MRVVSSWKKTMCAKRTSPRKHCKRRKCDAVEEGALIRTQKMQSEQNRRTVHLNFTLSPRARTLSPRARTRAHKAPDSPKGIFVLLKRRKDFDENFHFFDFSQTKTHKKKGKIIPQPHNILLNPPETLAKNTKKIQKNVPARARYIIRILSAPRNNVGTIQRVSCHPGTPRMLEY